MYISIQNLQSKDIMKVTATFCDLFTSLIGLIMWNGVDN